MEDLSLHILDIAENSINAGAKNIEIAIIEDSSKDLLTIEIKDDGKGMDADTIANVTNPFFTTRTTRRVGLGLAFLEEAANSTGGKLRVESELTTGTKVIAEFQLSHIDRKPVGNIADTIVMILAGNPEINLRYYQENNASKFLFDTNDVKKITNEIKINSIEILKFIRQYLEENVNKINK
ncbi:MAG: ATP-binding protein [Bacteroidota bacterium]|nr:ATP-binding protein [Bacteroidota bacterium]